MSKILVTGATGQFGKAAIEFLLKKGVNPADISALVRDESRAGGLKAKGVSLVRGDYDSYDSLIAAFAGIEKLLFVSGSDIANRVKQHENVVKAAKEAGVKHVVYTSFQRKNESESSPIALVAEGHIKAESLLKESGLTYTIMKNNIYMDMLPMFLGEQLLETGVAYLPAGDGKVGFALREDMAEAAAIILTGEGHQNREYDITGEEAVSIGEVASIISDVTGKTITYVSPTQEEYIKTLTEAGVRLHGDETVRSLVDTPVEPATDEDWETEYLGYEMAVGVVDSVDGAIAHIRRWSSGHTEAIVSNSATAIRRFTARLDSAAVMVNASTRFTDGGEFGFGAEIGISTQKLHARGPMGLTEMTSTKYVVTGNGHLR